jgi:hypothetical protein
MTMPALVVSYEDFIPSDFFAEFMTEARDDGVAVTLEARPSGPKMGVEWMIASAIIVFLAKPFLDDVLKRAANDVGNYVYPKLKTSSRPPSAAWQHEYSGVHLGNVSSRPVKNFRAKAAPFSSPLCRRRKQKSG